MTSPEPSRRCLPEADDARGRGCDIDFQRTNLRVIRAYRRDTRARGERVRLSGGARVGLCGVTGTLFATADVQPAS